jgi:hypothetical protein
VGPLVDGDEVSEELVVASFLAGVPPLFSDSSAFFRDSDG